MKTDVSNKREQFTNSTLKLSIEKSVSLNSNILEKSFIKV